MTQQAKGSILQSAVYIETEVCGPGPKENFEPNKQDNKPMKVTEAFDKFMESDKNVLLLSGAAVGVILSWQLSKLQTLIAMDPNCTIVHTAS